MRWWITFAAIGVLAAVSTPHAQQPSASQLPVRRVVLFKNGVGYFEHVGRVRGTQSLTIDFNSAQLNDVLKSLTTIDLGAGRIGHVSFNSEAPAAQRIKDVRAPVGPHTTLFDVLGALQGARIEARSGARTVAGRLLSVEHHAGAKDEAPRDELSLVTDEGLIRTVTLTPAVSVRLLERDLAQQMNASLEILGSNRAPDRRRMTIAALGTGERDILVSYVSEVPVWKTTYRIVLPSEEGGRPQLQGWAIVDNTIGEDWNGVELSLVAGAPQSFIQPLSQPIYVQRPTVGISRADTPAPQLHDSTLNEGGRVERGAGSTVRGVTGGVVGRVANAPQPPPPPRPEAAALDRVALEQKLEEMQASAVGESLGDLFAYRVAGPITIRTNESALVPILNTPVDVERVSLWNDRVGGARPLRALWLTNSSPLTLDAGSVAVLDEATFAGEGLIDPLKPGERRLVSYAVDLGVQVESRNGDEARRIGRVTIARGVAVQRDEQRTRKVYTVRNSDTTARVVVIEHPIRAGWTLAGDVKPAETSAHAYRFAVEAAPGQVVTLTVDERHPIETRYSIADLSDDQVAVFVRESRDNETVRQALAPIQALKAQAASIGRDIQSRDNATKAIADDQARLRENIRALKNSDDEKRLLKRYLAQLNDEEDRLAAIARERADLEARRQRVGADLVRLIDALSLDVQM